MERMNVDVSGYIDAKKAGTARLVKLNGVVHYIRTVFDPHTGAPQPQAIPVQRKEIENSLSELQKQAAVFEALLSDYDSAEEKLAAK